VANTKTSASKISAVVFDIGGVLLDWNPQYLYAELIPDEARREYFLTSICTRDWHRAHDLGVDTQESCLELARLHPDYAEEIMAWSERSEDMIGGVLDDTADILAELKSAGVPCFALSNMETDKFELRRARYEFFGLLDGCVISGLEGVAKPDRKIFEILLSRYGLAPEATVFIDDQPANVAAAKELGLVAIEFTTSAQLRRDLFDLGLPVGPTSRRPRPRPSTS
jgi:2-haloacid dehalogenase